MSLVNRVLDNTFRGLEKSLDLYHRRNQAITSNISNAETPQYRAVDLNFAGELERAFGANEEQIIKTNSGHMDISADGNAHLVQDLSGATKADGNNVDLDIQMGQLAFNGGKYSNASALLRKKLGILKMVLREVR